MLKTEGVRRKRMKGKIEDNERAHLTEERERRGREERANKKRGDEGIRLEYKRKEVKSRYEERKLR